MTIRLKWLYVGATVTALLQTGILYAGIEKRASVLRSGAEVTLQTEPFDPRDLMRGDYVVLGYEISSLSRKDIQGERPAGSRTVYVAVKPDTNGIARFSRASFVPLSDLTSGEEQIRARLLIPYPMMRNRIFVSILALNGIMYPRGRDVRLKTASASGGLLPLWRSIRTERRSSKPCRKTAGSFIRSLFIDPVITPCFKRVG